MGDERYAYSVGRVRAMETQLLERSRIERMVEASDAEEALKVLGETKYAEHFAALDSAHDYETMLGQEAHRFYLEMQQFSPEPELIGLFTCKFDYHNLKVIFKAQAMAEKRDELLFKDLGRIPATTLIRAVEEDDYTSLPPRMRYAAEDLSEALRLELDPQLVDLLLDRAMFAEIFDMLEKLASPILTEHFTSLVDLLNIKTYLRVKRADHTKELLSQALLPFGEIDMSQLVQLADPLEVLVDRLAFGCYAQLIDEAIQAYRETSTLTRFEKLADDFLLKQITKSKYVTFGPEPFAAFILAKENEIKVVRIIMVGKINRLPAADIRERLRELYA